MNGAQQHFPGPMAALLISLAAVFSAGLVIVLFGPEADLGSVGVGEALGFGLVATLAAQRVPPPQRERLGLRGFEPAFLPLLALLLPLVVVQSELDNLMAAVLPAVEVPEAARELEKALEPVSSLEIIQQVIVVVGIAPVVEEWLFRGVIQQGLVARMGRMSGVLLTSALFALAHLPSGAPGAHALFSPLVNALSLGCVLGTLRLATGSLLAPIVFAAAVNAVVLTAIHLGESFPIPGFNAPGDHTPISVLLPCTLAVCWALATIARRASQALVALPIPEKNA
jgi:membrane protease YdiL (CAAX protease family)